MTAFAVLSVLVLSSVSWTGTDAYHGLQNDSAPIFYKLHVEITDLRMPIFNASVIIKFIMTATSPVLVMHQRDLMIDTIEVEGNTLKQKNVDNKTELLITYWTNDFEMNKEYIIKINYSAAFTDSVNGFFRRHYTIGNETKWMAATFFEPTYARRVLPCWDEPIYKAIFNVSIRHQSIYRTVLSNMPIANQTHHDDGNTTTYFESSNPMSSYLLAFVISDYVYNSHDDDRYKIYAPPDTVNQTELAYNFSLKAMKVMDEYTGISYFHMNSKIDQIAIIDLNASAMENWGLITYDEDTFLYEEGVSTILDKQMVIGSIAHEFSHQWYGNLVTPIWWADLWLKEGFAHYFEYYIVDKVMPEWRYMDLFTVESMQHGAFLYDLSNARPIIHMVSDPEEIANRFNEVTYDKAACILRMLSHVLTEKVFHTSLKKVLHIHSPENFDTVNLIKIFQQVAGNTTTWGGVPLAEIVKTWFRQSGYPMVTVKRSGRGLFTLNQNHFLYLHWPDESKKWWIPITYVANHYLNFADTSVNHWLDPNVENSTIVEPEAEWILLNKQQIGYYRVNYDDVIWYKLSQYLRNTEDMHKIHPVNRAQLIDDALAMAHAEHIKYDTAFSLMLYLFHETDYIPWLTVFKNLEFLDPKMACSEHYDSFKHYIKYIMHSVTKNITYVSSPKDDLPTKLLKHHAMKWACQANVKECVDEAHKEFNVWLKDSNHHLDPDMKETILCTALRTASEAVWLEAQYKLSEEEDIDEISNENPLKVLGCSNNEKILHKFLISAGRRDTNISFVVAADAVIANTNVTGYEIVFKFLKNQIKNYKQIIKIKGFYHQIASVMKTLAKAVRGDSDFVELAHFGDWMRFNETTMQEIVSNAMAQSKWLSIHKNPINQWLLENEELFKSSGTEKMFVSLLLIISIFNTMIFKIFL